MAAVQSCVRGPIHMYHFFEPKFAVLALALGAPRWYDMYVKHNAQLPRQAASPIVWSGTWPISVRSLRSYLIGIIPDLRFCLFRGWKDIQHDHPKEHPERRLHRAP